jgi:diaminopimelate epimerase
MVNAHRRELTGAAARISMPGGDLFMQWRQDGHVLMTGTIATTFTGQVDPRALAA